jgi:hypothetical protein
MSSTFVGAMVHHKEATKLRRLVVKLDEGFQKNRRVAKVISKVLVDEKATLT